MSGITHTPVMRHTVDTHVNSLRAQVEERSSAPKLLSRGGVGYRS